MIRTLMIGASALAALPFGSASAQESFYFSDTLGPGESVLSTLELDGACPQARVVPLPVGENGDGVVPYDDVVAIAVEPSGERLWIIDSDANRNLLVSVDLTDGTLSDPLEIYPDVPVLPNGLGTIQQAAFSLDGTLYVTSSGQDRLYTLDLTSGDATSLGEVIWDLDGTTAIDIQGADLAFASDGTFYMFTNADDFAPGGTEGRLETPRGLYRLTLPEGEEGVLATYLGAGGLQIVTGMAIRNGGLGDIIVSEVDQLMPGEPATPGEIIVLDRETGAELDRYTMGDAACDPFIHLFGDLNNGPLTPPECFLVIGDGPGNAPFLEIGHLFQTQVGPEVQASHAVLLDLTPEFVLPAPLLQGGVAGGGPAAAPTGAPPAWMRDGSFSVQVVMWNPTLFPALPEQHTAGLHVRLLPGGGVLATPYGTDQGGLQIWHELDTNAQGQRVVRFPFSIPGM